MENEAATVCAAHGNMRRPAARRHRWLRTARSPSTVSR
jgi:hypothetical protein